MKILQISNSHDLRDGGAQRLAVEFHRAFLERGHDAHLLSLMRSPTRDLPHLYSLGLRTPYHTRVLPRLLDALRQPRWRDVDIVHVHLFPAQVLAPLALQVLGRRAPLVTTEHNTFNRRRATSAGRAFDAAYYKSYKRIIAISEGTRDEMARWLPSTTSKLHVITNGIDLSAFPSTCPEQVLERPGEAPLILSMGRISPQKNYPAALRAVAQLRDKRIPFRYQIAGAAESPAAAQEIESLLDELQLREQVQVLGFCPDAAALRNRAAVFLIPSRWEGFGLAAAEAMASGLPVVGSDVPGLREVVGEDGAAGFLAPVDDDATLAARLKELLQNSELRARMSRAAHERAQRFDIRKSIDAHLDLYREVIAEAGQR